MTDLRRELADSLMQRQEAAGLKPVISVIQIDHGVPCWLMRSGLQQLFGPKRLEDEELHDADALWLYDKVKTLHNSDLNARIMTEVSHRTLLRCAAASATCSRLQPRQVRNQFFIPVSVVLGQGRRMAEVRIQPMPQALAQECAVRLQLGCLWAAVGRRCGDDARELPFLRDGAVPHRRCRGGGLEAAAGRLPAGQVALRHGRRCQAVSESTGGVRVE